MSALTGRVSIPQGDSAVRVPNKRQAGTVSFVWVCEEQQISACVIQDEPHVSHAKRLCSLNALAYLYKPPFRLVIKFRTRLHLS